MKKGSRKASDSLESYSYRAFKEQVRQIFITDEIKIRLILPHGGVNILPAPHPWVEKGTFPLLVSENSISALGREPCNQNREARKISSVWTQCGARREPWHFEEMAEGWVQRKQRHLSAAMNQAVDSQEFNIPVVGIFCRLILDNCVLSTGMTDPSSPSMPHALYAFTNFLDTVYALEELATGKARSHWQG